MWNGVFTIKGIWVLMIVSMGHSDCFHFLDGCDKMLLLYLYVK